MALRFLNVKPRWEGNQKTRNLIFQSHITKESTNASKSTRLVPYSLDTNYSHQKERES